MKSFAMCPECKVCCGTTGPSLHKKEIPIMEKQIGRKISVKKYGNIYRPVSVDEKCIFLGKNGCILSQKPLSCYIWPFIPSNKGWIMRMSCKYWWTITRENFEDIKRYYEKRKHLWKNVVELEGDISRGSDKKDR